MGGLLFAKAAIAIILRRGAFEAEALKSDHEPFKYGNI